MVIAVGENITLKISHLANLGDGVANYEDTQVFVPYTCAGDKIIAQVQEIKNSEVRAKLIEIIEPSNDRVKPKCEYFGACGGCKLQHLNDDTYKNFKENILLQIIKRLKVDESIIDEIFQVGYYARRRVDFKVSVNKGLVSLGFYSAKSHDIVDINNCIITENSITKIIPQLKEFLASLKNVGDITSISFSSLENGLDAVIETKKAFKDKEKFINFAKQNNIIRFCEKVKDEHYYSRFYDSNLVEIKFGDVKVSLPIAPFLQASLSAQQMITDILLRNISGAKNILDLFSGCGTYSFPAAQNANVVAFEGDAEMVLAMLNAARRAGLEGKISANKRDLFLNPLKVDELEKFDAIIINPPRVGAKAQVEQIAKSKINKVIMVSCNATSFERDAKILLNSGFNLKYAKPIDQFFQSKHLEIIAIFEGGRWSGVINSSFSY